MYASSNTFLDCRSPEHVQALKHDSCALCTITDGLDIADLLNNDDKLTSPLGSPYTMGSSRAELDGADPAPQNRDPLHLLSAPPPLLSPTATLCGPKDWPLRTARHAKRARVENIIRDMAGSSFSPFLEPDTDGAPEDGQGDKGPREWPPDGVQAQRAGRSSVVGCWSSEDPAIKNQLQNMKCQPLLKFRRSGGLPPEDWERDSDQPKEETPLEETHSFGSDSPSKDPYDIFTDPHCGDGFDVPLNRKACGRKKVRVQTASSSPGTPDTANALMADILKYELSRAVSMSVDSIFKIMPRLEPHPPAAAPAVVVMERSAVTGLPHESPLSRPRQGTPPGTSLYGETVCGSTLPEVQTEALSLVVQRAPRLRPYAICRPPHQHHGEQEFPSSHRSEPQGSEGNKGGAADPVRRDKNLCEGLKQEVLATGGAPGSKVRCKVNSRSVRGARHFALDPGFLGDLCVPMDVQTRADGPQSMLMSTLFSLNDGLTTSHLKKAKLMFFYTRYPNSLVLKTFFHDVQFTRCITSQLIKWFSNFREFYYIQMEKQARQAVAEGVAHTGALTVGRESELFRTLNMHYNKASDFQVPERFLEVAEMTLREFYVAVSLGKDCDPSWKKPIYKVICKLDSNVPEEFKAHYPD
ncbi:prospero homeobox protein 2-like [Gadus morhua]|uniref:prospero homeobox protein 2-like n=1 Tax=Gadus morhua TaxID=8049 RepID=UPI0011B5F9C6|nr:prospero homeobox protein 2-like [Gadus morhua]